MKKQVLIICLAVVSILSTSCNNKPATEPAPDPESKPELKTEQTTNNNERKTTMITKLTKADFLTKVANYEGKVDEWEYLGDKPAIIDFYADWCGPCRKIAPILEELAEEYAGEIYIYKIDVDKEQDLAADFGIRSIPSVLFVPMKGQPQMAQGALPKSAFKEAIETVLLVK